MLAVSMTPPVAHFLPAAKRPKLTLQTSALPIAFSCSSKVTTTSTVTTTNTSTATTPTTLNTFNNTYDLTYRPSPTSAVESTKSANEPSSHSSSPSSTSDQPYSLNLPFGVKPILKNTPYPSLRTDSLSASPVNRRKVFFPQAKKVTFRESEDVIVTEKFTARHSDLLEASDDEDLDVEPRSVEGTKTTSPTKRKYSRRDSGICLPAGDLAESEQPEGRIVRRFSSRKRRRWEWTLNPLDTTKSQQSDEAVEAVETTQVAEDEETENEDESSRSHTTRTVVKSRKAEAEELRQQKPVSRPCTKRSASNSGLEHDEILSPAPKKATRIRMNRTITW